MKYSLLLKTFIFALLFMLSLQSKSQTAKDYFKKGIAKYNYRAPLIINFS